MIYWLLGLAGITTAVATTQQGAPLNELEALARAQAAVAQYHWVNRPQRCLNYIATSKEWTFDLHAIHGGGCGGNPDTSPRVLSLRVDSFSGEVQKL